MELQSIDMLDMLEQLINNGKKSLISNKVSIDKDEALEIISELKGIMPDEIVQANAYYKESRTILENARNDSAVILNKAQDQADNKIDDAKEQANAIVSEAHEEAEDIIKEAEEKREKLIDAHEITVAAQANAERIIEDANNKANEIKKGTREYLDSKLLNLSDFLAKTYSEVEANRKGL